MPRRMPYHYEPWRAYRRTTFAEGGRDRPPDVDDEDVRSRWHDSRHRALAAAPVQLFGSGLRESSVTYTLAGEPGLHPGDGIVATVHPIHHDHPKGADLVQVGDRIVACVNALAGVADPVATLDLARSLLWEIHKGYTDGDDDRVVRLLDMLHPSETYTDMQRRIFGGTDE